MGWDLNDFVAGLGEIVILIMKVERACDVLAWRQYPCNDKYANDLS